MTENLTILRIKQIFFLTTKKGSNELINSIKQKSNCSNQTKIQTQFMGYSFWTKNEIKLNPFPENTMKKKITTIITK